MFSRLQLLLFLSALLTAFTGLVSGDRVVERAQVERTAVGSAVEAIVETAAPAVRAMPEILERTANPAAAPLATVQDGAVLTVLQVNNRRRE